MYAFGLAFERFTKNVSFRSRTRSPTTATVIVFVFTPTGKVRVPLVAWKSDGVPAEPAAEAKETVTGESGLPESETTKVKAVVPLLPSLPWASAIWTLHSKRRSCRWFLSPQPLPGLVTVGVVVLVLVLVDVDVDVVVGVVVVVVDVDVVVGVVVVVVDVEVVVGVVVVVVDVDVVVEPVVVVVEYWSARAVSSPADVAYPSPPSPTSGTSTATVAIATTTIRRRRVRCLIPTSPWYEHGVSLLRCQSHWRNRASVKFPCK
jgi:hypothetical protein